MMVSRVARLSLVVTLSVLATTMLSAPATACSLPEYEDNGRYVGGDLVSQIVSKADTIQIVRVTGRHVVSRTYSEGQWYLSTGETDVPEHQPEYIDQYVYEHSVVEPLKGATDTASFLYEDHPRVLAYGATEVFEAYGRETQASAVRAHPNRLPEWLTDRPGNEGTAFTGGAEVGAGLGLGECTGPYFLDVGQTFIALRDNIGRLYPASGAFPLRIDTEFRSGGRRVRMSFNMQSLIPTTGDDDPFLMSLRQHLAQPH